MAQQLTDLSIREVTFCPLGMNQHAKVMLFKMKGNEEMASSALPYWKRNFDAAQRENAAESGAALPDGSYPIKTKQDLINAMRAIGRADNPSKVKAHIRSRARALGLTSELSDAFKMAEWFGKIDKAHGIGQAILKDEADGDARDFNDVQDATEAGEFAQGMLEEIEEAMCSLRIAVNEIMCDDETPDKQAALDETFDQFKEHIQGVVPEWMEETTAKSLAAAKAVIGEGDQSVDSIKKLLGLKPDATDKEVTEAMNKALADAKFGAAVAKMSAKHTAFMNHEDATLPKGGKSAFADMTPAERDAHMKKNPIDDEEDAADGGDGEAAEKAKLKKFMETLPEPVRKSIEAGQKAQEEVAKLREKDELNEINKAVAPLSFIGKAEELSKLLIGIRKADQAAYDSLVSLFSALNDRFNKSDMFREHGSGASGLIGVGKAFDTIEKMARELMTKEPTVYKSLPVARDAIRRRNPELAKQEEAERKEAKRAA